MSAFDEQPDAPLHGECAAEIRRLEQQRDALLAALNKIADECYTPLPSRETLADIYKIAAVAIDLAGAPIARAEGNQTTK